MPLTVAIHPDRYTAAGSPYEDASSEKWAAALEAAGIKVRWVDARSHSILEDLEGCDGFMWRWGHFHGMRRVASRLLPIVERELGMAVYPDQRTCWHYDDKIAQHFLFQTHNIPTPETWVWFSEAQALEWARSADYPVVMKLATGAGSRNVRLVRDFDDARWWIGQMFRFGRWSLASRRNWRDRIRSIPRRLLKGRYLHSLYIGGELQIGYAYFQQFIPGNDFDTRVSVIGNRAFAYRRFNRPNDFRASGSGNFSCEPSAIPESTIRFATEVAAKLQMQSLALDILYHDGQPIVNEISYTFITGMIHECPGHWEVNGSQETGSLNWHDGHMWPEEAQIQDFIQRLQLRQASK